MTPATTSASLLDHLFTEEIRSLLPRLETINIFVASTSRADLRTIQRMTAEASEHQAWLVDAIEAAGGYPGPASPNPLAGHLHYVELHALLPMILSDEQRLITAYETAATKATGPDAELINRILARHRAHAETIKSMISSQ